MKRTIWATLGGLIIGAALTVCAAGQNVRVIDTGDTNVLLRDAEVVDDAKEGKHALAMKLPPGKRAFFSLDLGKAGVDITQVQAIAFWWKVKGAGFEDFTIKFMHADLKEGRQVLYHVWKGSSETAPTEWVPAVIVLSESSGTWGSPQSRHRNMQFRVQTEAGSEATLLVDHIVALPGAFRVETAPAVLAGGKWRSNVRLTNDGARDLSVRLAIGDAPAQTLRLPATKTLEKTVTLCVAGDVLAKRKPLDSVEVPIRAELEGAPVTRTTSRIRIIKPLDMPAHPRLLVDADQVRGIQRRIERHDWAKAAWGKLQKSADEACEKPLELPLRGSGNPGIYSNPETGAKLKTGKKIGAWEWEHIDTRTGEVLKGDPAKKETDFDGWVINGRHQQWAKRARDAGLAYQISGEEKYAAKARAILMGYAEKYLTYQLGDGGPLERPATGRVGWGYLLESMWLIDMLHAADCVWDKLGESDRKALKERVFYPAVRESILPVHSGIHNIQNWMNSAVGLVGFLYDDPELLRDAIHDPEEGYWRQLEKGVSPDGMWCEGAWGYHFFTIMGATPLLEAARHCGLDLYGEKMRELYRAPIRYAMPDLYLPNFNDSGRVPLHKRAHWYEVAAARYPDEPLFRAMVALRPRETREALLYGVEEAGDAPDLDLESRNFGHAGYAVLTQGKGKDATWLCFKYGPHGGWHGHPDKLTFILYARGEIVSPDPGSTNYGSVLQDTWYKTSLSHNTLVVDEESYTNKTHGNCRAFGEVEGVQYVVGDAGKCWPGVTFTRTVALVSKELVVGIDQVRADGERLLDIAYHQAGEWQGLEGGEAWAPPRKGAYQYLRDGATRPMDKSIGLATRVSDALAVGVGFAPSPDAQLITATGFLRHQDDRVPMAIVRKRGASLASAWAISLDGQAPTVSLRDVRDASGKVLGRETAVAVDVETGSGVSLTIIANPDGLGIAAEGKGDGPEARVRVVRR